MEINRQAMSNEFSEEWLSNIVVLITFGVFSLNNRYAKMQIRDGYLHLHEPELQQSKPFCSVILADIYAVFQFNSSHQFKMLILPPSNSSVSPEDCYMIVQCENIMACNKWISILTRYVTKWTETKPCKALVFINPKSGARGDMLYGNFLYKLFKTASDYMPHLFSFTHFETQFYNHAFALIKEGDFIYDYNVIVAIGGDGLVHEIANALMERADSKAIYERLSLAVIPAGTNNTLALALNANRYTLPRKVNHQHPSVKYKQVATLFFSMIIKGRSIPINVLEIFQKRCHRFCLFASVIGDFSELVQFSEKFRYYRLHDDTSYIHDALNHIHHDYFFRARIHYVANLTGERLLDRYFPEHKRGHIELRSITDVKVIDGEFLFIATVNNGHIDKYLTLNANLDLVNKGTTELLWISKNERDAPNVPHGTVSFLKEYSKTKDGRKMSRLYISRIKARAYKIEFLNFNCLPRNVTMDGEFIGNNYTVYGEVHRNMLHIML